MLSIIICSANDDRFAATAAMYGNLLGGQAYEIVRIADARSLCAGYNRGIAASKGEHLVFSHDDVQVISADWAHRVQEHLAEYDIVGVAGTNRLLGGAWIAAGPPHIFGQVAHRAPNGVLIQIYGVHGHVTGGIQALDGLFFAARRSVVQQITFDAQNFDGFHHYDLDFCFAAYLAGFKIAVANDIHVMHGFPHMPDPSWAMYNQRFGKKYAGRLSAMTPRHWSLATVTVRTPEEAHQTMTDIVRNSTFSA